MKPRPELKESPWVSSFEKDSSTDQPSFPSPPSSPSSLRSPSPSNPTALAEVIKKSRTFMSSTAKAKTAKISEPDPARVELSIVSSKLTFLHLPSFLLSPFPPVRTLIDYFSAIPNAQAAQIECTKENIEWARTEKRVFLRQNLETKLAGL